MNAQSKRLGLDIERVWVWRDAGGALRCASGARPAAAAVEYMRVMSRDEVEGLALREGCDSQQFLNSVRRTIEGQRREIARLNAKVAALTEVPVV